MNTGQFLKCDADGCDHREDIDQLTADMIGKPCPKCGASLLTAEDYEQFAGLSAQMAEFVAKLEMLDAALLLGSAEPEPGQRAVRVEMGLFDGEFRLSMSAPVDAFAV